MPITVPLQKECRMPAGVTCLINVVEVVCVHSIFIKTAKKNMKTKSKLTLPSLGTVIKTAILLL